MFKKLTLKQQLFVVFFILIIGTVVAIVTPWGQNKMLIVAPVIVFAAFVGSLIAYYLFNESNKES